MCDSLLLMMLKSSGGLQDIYDAMDSDDVVDVVRTTYKALIKIKSIPLQQRYVKAADISKEFRMLGNKHYEIENFEEAIILYNKALAYAPTNSTEIKLAHANSSAVMFTIKAYEACLEHINACFAMGCPQHIKRKLDKRMIKTKNLIDAGNMPNENYIKHLEFNVEKNAEVPCVSKDVDFLNTGRLKNVIAARDITSGTIVAMERAFVSTQTYNKQYVSCYYCHKIALFLLPCDGCCKALFCSEDCRIKCYNEFHRIECHIVGYMGTMYVEPVNILMVRAAIKISLKLGWKELSVVSKDIGVTRLTKSSIKSAFDVNDPLSILSYDDQKAITKGKIFNGSFICAGALYSLEQVPNYFPKGDKARKEAFDAISRIMLQLCATFTNRININCSAYDYYADIKKVHIQRNVGWFSLTSKLKHSCEPNLYVLGLNDHVALVTVRPIKKGEDLTITYVDHYYDVIYENLRSKRFSSTRQQQIFSTIQTICECRVCVNRWDYSSIPPVTISNVNMKVIFELNDLNKNFNHSKAIKTFTLALDEMASLANTMQHRSVFSLYRYFLNECHCAKNQNKTYTTAKCKNDEYWGI